MKNKKSEKLSIKNWFQFLPGKDDTIFFTEKSTAALEIFRIATAFFRITGKKIVVTLPSFSAAEQVSGESAVWNHALETGLTTGRDMEGKSYPGR